MPRSAIMLKFSDVLNDGERSPANYFEQVLRCPGEMPINVAATINNRWILDAGIGAQSSLAAEFLSASITSKVRRFHQRVLRGRDAVLFTRAGALLNLKVLLGMDRPAGGFRRTALGAISLHANDYVESADTSRLSSGTLPVIAEFAPVWELQNIREPMPLLRRSYFLYSTLLQADARMQSLFDRPIAELEFGGLPFRKYFPLLFGIYTVTSSAALDQRLPTSIPPAADVADKAGVTTEQFAAFAASKSLTLAEACSAFGPLDERAVFVDRVTTSTWVGDLRVFRNRPLLQLSDGRFLVTDLQFLLESTSAGLPWSLAQWLRGTARDRFFEFWGGLFETYVQRLLAHYYADPVEHRFGDMQIDGVLPLGDDLLVMEVKAGFMREAAKCSRDEEVFAEALHEKFVTNEKGKRKGVRQLAATVGAILDGTAGLTCRGRIYPVLVGEDPVLQTIALNTYLNDVFRQEVTVGDRVAPLTVMLVDELEQVLPYVRAGDLSWQELLSARFVGERIAAASVHDAFADLAIARRLRERAEGFLTGSADELIALLNDAYTDLS